MRVYQFHHVPLGAENYTTGIDRINIVFRLDFLISTIGPFYCL